MKKISKNARLFLLSIFIIIVVNLIGAGFTQPSIEGWYNNLVKPSFNPPSWLFMPAWLFLYFLIALSLFLVLRKDHPKKKQSLWIFGIQLVLNSLWSVIFFGLHLPLIAFIEIIFLWIFILLTMIWFYKIDKDAAFLLIPYLMWVSFASVLNFAIYYLN